MESWFQYRARMEKQERRKRLIGAIKEFVGAIVFLATLFGLGLLCSVCSGYHWE